MKNNKGFSLVEMIVVVSIMAVLVGVLTPSMIRYVERSREAVDLVNVRSAVGEVVAAATSEDHKASYSIDGQTIYQNDQVYYAEVPLRQLAAGWSSNFSSLSVYDVSYADAHWIGEPRAKGTCKVYLQDGELYLDWGGDQIVYDNSNSIAKYVLNSVQKDLTNHIANNISEYAEIFTAKKLNSSLATTITLPNKKSVNLIIYNRNYDNYTDIKTRMVENTASLIYNSSTDTISTIIYYDGKDYTSWSLTDGQWLDNSYVTKQG